MAAENEDFNISGPTHLTDVDWDNDDQRRTVAAALVNGVYILERDRQEKRAGPQALAPTWWEFFHFKLLNQLLDRKDNSIFAAVFEYEPKDSPDISNSSKKGIPHYIIAFRGTLTNRDSISRDLHHDLQVIVNGLHKTSRVETAITTVRDTVVSAENMNVWLAGHSLGSSMALLAGKTMALSGTYIDTFLFNPPFFSAPIESINNETVKHGIRVAGSVVTAGLALAVKLKSKSKSSSDPFTAMATWVPNLFVHPADHICSEYIGYFTNRKKMEELGVGELGRLASQHSFGGLMMSTVGKEAEPAAHLIPSARLTVNKGSASDFMKAHALQQWWSSDLELETDDYLYA